MRLLALPIATAGYVGRFPGGAGHGGLRRGVVPVGGGAAGRRWARRRADALAVLFVVGAWAATETERVLGVTDPGPVVIDEVMGMCLTHGRARR